MRQSTKRIAKIGFQNPHLNAVGVDVLRLHELRARAAATLVAPQRVEFYLLMLIQEGRCRHTIDFVDYELKPGSVVFLRPGQVQQWHMRDSVQGVMVLMSDKAISQPIGLTDLNTTLLALDQWPAASVVSMGLFLQAYSDAMRLREDTRHYSGAARESAIIWHALMALLLRLARELHVGEVSMHVEREASIYRKFCKELEGSFRKRLTAIDYARRLGYSQSTLARACQVIAGSSAKTLIDGRVALEAKRLLVHSDTSVAQIGNQLGFFEPTNFVKFFRRIEGSTPQNYRLKALKK